MPKIKQKSFKIITPKPNNKNRHHKKERKQKKQENFALNDSLPHNSHLSSIIFMLLLIVTYSLKARNPRFTDQS